MEDLTPEHGFDIHVGGLDDEFDPSQFLFVKRCKKCGKIEAFVSDNYWSKYTPKFRRDPSQQEMDMFFRHLNTIAKKTAVTNRLNTAGFTLVELLIVLAIILILVGIAWEPIVSVVSWLWLWICKLVTGRF